MHIELLVTQFVDSMPHMDDAVLQNVCGMIHKELAVRTQRMIADRKLPPMAKEEFDLGRIEGIKAYRNRTMLGLHDCIHAYKVAALVYFPQ